MKVGLLGDVHGAKHWTLHAIDKLTSAGCEYIIQAGDFGIWHGDAGNDFLESVNKELTYKDVFMYVVPGNHEDYTMIVDPETENGRIPHAQYIGTNIGVLPRGYCFSLGGTRFMTFGGAASIDRPMRTEGVDWWPEEMFRESDMERLKNIKPGDIDVLISHEATSNGTYAVQEILNTPQSQRYSMWDYHYAAASTTFMDRVLEKIKPKMHVHGHMHVADERVDEEAGIHYVSLDMNGTTGNLAVLDTETMKVDRRVL